MQQAQQHKTKIGRNDPCQCGSGKKYKQCCQTQAAVRVARPPSVDVSVPGLLRAATEHHQAGRLPQAEALYRQILQAAPNNPDALHLLGLIAHQSGKIEIAVDLISRAIRINPSGPMYYNLGVALQAGGVMDAAVESYRKALALNPEYAEAHSNLGTVLQAQGKYDAAAEHLHQALRFRPKDFAAHSNLGVVQQAQGHLDAALESFRRALAINPDYAEAHNNLGMVQHAQVQLEAALESFQRALAINPVYAEAHNNLGMVLQEQGQLEAALVCFRHALSIKPDYIEAHGNIGVVLLAQGQLDAAEASFHQALSINPQDADAHYNLSHVLLLRGASQAGWREYEWRVRHRFGRDYIADPRDPSRTLPRPSTLCPFDLADKRILLMREQGIGDEIFFLSFAALARQHGAWLAYQPSEKIASLVQRVPGLDAVLPLGEVPSNLDLIMLVGDLPLLLGLDSLQDIPPPLPLSVLPERLSAMRARLAAFGGRPVLGVTWRAGSERIAGQRKSRLFKETDISHLGQVLSAWPGEVLILQRQPRAAEMQEFTQALGRPAHDWSELNDSLEDMLALLALIDEYVGVSNTNMHLMAGLGKTARVLVTNPPEWRWMSERQESPWFPGFQLYRQQRDGAWTEALDRLAEDMQNRSYPAR